MSIATELDRIKNTDIPALKSAITDKGGTLGITGRDIQDCATGVNSITVGGGGLTDAGTLNVTENGTYTPTSGGGYSEVNVNVPTGGGETVIPTVYAKLERIVLRTPADAVADYAGVWTRDSAWLDMATVPMTFQSGSFGWTGTRALARYTKTVNGTVVYLYLYLLDGYYYDDTTAWDAVGVANAQQFFDNIGTLGWSGEMYMCYCFSTTDYTPAQITEAKSVAGNTPFGTYSQAYAWTMPSPFNGPWDLLGLDDMWMGGSGDLTTTYSNKSAASLTVAATLNTSSESYNSWAVSSGNWEGAYNWGRLFYPPETDVITGTWVQQDNPEFPAIGYDAPFGKHREWFNENTGAFAADYTGWGSDSIVNGYKTGIAFKRNKPLHTYPLQWHHNSGWKPLEVGIMGTKLFPRYTYYTVDVLQGGTGYQIGDWITMQVPVQNETSVAEWDERMATNPTYRGLGFRDMSFVVAETGTDGAVTKLCIDSFINSNSGNSCYKLMVLHELLVDSTTQLLTDNVTLPDQISETPITRTNSTGSGMQCRLKIEGHGSAFKEPGVRYWTASLVDYNAIPKYYELYKLTTSLSPIEEIPESVMTLTVTEKDNHGDVEMELYGSGYVTIDWGDGTSTTKSIGVHRYFPERDLSLSDEQIISITGRVTWLRFDVEGTVALDVSTNPALLRLNTEFSKLPGLDLSGNPVLTHLSCWHAGLTTLDLSANPALEYLMCSYNQLTTLDLSGNPALESLICTGNPLTTLDVSANPALRSIDARACQLTSATVNGILASLVAGGLAEEGPLNVVLHDQTPSAPPTGQGLIDKQTLIDLGCNVVTD